MWIILAAGFGFLTEVGDSLGLADRAFQTVGALGVGALVALGLALVAGAWLVSVFTTALTYAGFTVRRTGPRLEIERGLLEHQIVSVPLDRVQAVRVKEGAIRRLFGFAELHVDTAGYGSSGEDTGRTVLHPFLRASEIPALVDSALPDFVEFTSVRRLPQRAMRRYVIRWVVPAGLIALVVALIPQLRVGAWALLLLLPAVALGAASWAASGWGLAGTTLALRGGMFGRTTHYIPRRRIQSLAVAQNPFQRLATLASLRVAIVSGSSGKRVTLSHLEVSDAVDVLSWYEPGGQET